MKLELYRPTPSFSWTPKNEKTRTDLVTVMKQIGFVVVEGLPRLLFNRTRACSESIYIPVNPEGITKLLMNISEKIGNRKLSKQILSNIFDGWKTLCLERRSVNSFLAKATNKGF